MQLIIVHRLLQSILLPPLNAVCIIFFGYLLLSRYKKIGKTLMGLGILFFYIQTTPIFAYSITKAIELPPVTPLALKNSQAIIVLGGGVNSNSYEYHTVTALPNTLVRLSYAAYLAKQHPDMPIVTSGGYTSKKFSEASVMQRILINTFAVKNPIIIEGKSRDTNENAKFVAKILLAKQIHNVVIVS